MHPMFNELERRPSPDPPPEPGRGFRGEGGRGHLMLIAFLAVVLLVVAAGYWQRMWAALDQFSIERQREREARFLAQQKAIAGQWKRERCHD